MTNTPQHDEHVIIYRAITLATEYIEMWKLGALAALDLYEQAEEHGFRIRRNDRSAASSPSQIAEGEYWASQRNRSADR